MHLWMFLFVFLSLINISLVNTSVIFAQEILLEDPLTQSTIGRLEGAGEFLADGGWRSQGGFIVYDAGRSLEDGYFEATMQGWTPPAQGIDKSHPLSGWEFDEQFTHYAQMGSFWNWRIGTGYFPFKVLAAPQTINTRVEARVGNVDAFPNDGPHRYRVEWRGGTVRFLFNGQLLQEWAFDHFALRYFLVGKDEQYGITNPTPIISDVIVVDRSQMMEPMPEPETMPQPDPDGESFTLILSPSQDTFADPESAATPQGALDNMQVGGDGRGEAGRTIYLQFDLGQVDGIIEEVDLRLRATNSGQAGSIHSVESDEWREDELTWQNRPAVGPLVFASLNNVMADMTYEWSLNGPFPAGEAMWSLAITSTEDDGAAFASKEHSDEELRPVLVVSFRRGEHTPDVGNDLGIPIDAGQSSTDYNIPQPFRDSGVLGYDAVDAGDVSSMISEPDESLELPGEELPEEELPEEELPEEEGEDLNADPVFSGCAIVADELGEGSLSIMLLVCLILLLFLTRKRLSDELCQN